MRRTNSTDESGAIAEIGKAEGGVAVGGGQYILAAEPCVVNAPLRATCCIEQKYRTEEQSQTVARREALARRSLRNASSKAR